LKSFLGITRSIQVNENLISFCEISQGLFLCQNYKEVKMDRTITEKEAATHLGLAVQTLRNWRSRRKGPPYLKISRAVRYKISDVEEFLEQHKIFPEKVDD